MNDHAEVLREMYEDTDPRTGRFFHGSPEHKAIGYAIEAIAALEAGRSGEARQPDGYAYRYPDGCIRHNSGREVNGSTPTEAIPYYYAAAPQQPPPVGVTDAVRESVEKCLSRAMRDHDEQPSAFKEGIVKGLEEALRAIRRQSVTPCGDTANKANDPSGDALSHQQPAPSVSDLERMKQQARFRAACYALVQLVEGHPVHRWVDGDGLRLKDAPEWVAFYTITGAMRNGLHAAPVSEPAYTKADDLLHTIGGVEHPDAASGEGDGFNGDNTRLCQCIDALVSMNDRGAIFPHGIGGHARALLVAAASRIRRLTATGQGDVERLVAVARKARPAGEVGWPSAYLLEPADAAELREALAPFGQQQEPR